MARGFMVHHYYFVFLSLLVIVPFLFENMMNSVSGTVIYANGTSDQSVICPNGSACMVYCGGGFNGNITCPVKRSCTIDSSGTACSPSVISAVNTTGLTVNANTPNSFENTVIECTTVNRGSNCTFNANQQNTFRNSILYTSESTVFNLTDDTFENSLVHVINLDYGSSILQTTTRAFRNATLFLGIDEGIFPTILSNVNYDLPAGKTNTLQTLWQLSLTNSHVYSDNATGIINCSLANTCNNLTLSCRNNANCTAFNSVNNTFNDLTMNCNQNSICSINASSSNSRITFNCSTDSTCTLYCNSRTSCLDSCMSNTVQCIGRYCSNVVYCPYYVDVLTLSCPDWTSPNPYFKAYCDSNNTLIVNQSIYVDQHSLSSSRKRSGITDGTTIVVPQPVKIYGNVDFNNVNLVFQVSNTTYGQLIVSLNCTVENSSVALQILSRLTPNTTLQLVQASNTDWNNNFNGIQVQYFQDSAGTQGSCDTNDDSHSYFNVGGIISIVLAKDPEGCKDSVGAGNSNNNYNDGGASVRNKIIIGVTVSVGGCLVLLFVLILIVIVSVGVYRRYHKKLGRGVVNF